MRPAGDALAAARLASERAELWVPGAVAWLACLGWLPFVLGVTTFPGEGDVAFFGAGLVTSGAWPWNAAALLVAVAAFATLSLAALAVGEVGLAAAARRAAGAPPLREPAAASGRLLAIELVAAAPVAIGVTAVAIAVAAVAPSEFGSPDIGGGLALRIALRVAPIALAALLVALVAQVLAAAAGRRVVAGQAVGPGLAAGLGDVRRGLLRLLLVALVSGLAGLAYLALAGVMVRVLWRPIGEALAGAPIDAGAGLLLVGFVAIWLCLVLGGGAVHAWASTWWTLELAAVREAGAGPADPREMPSADA